MRRANNVVNLEVNFAVKNQDPGTK
jgi:hypothetical protein